MYHLLLAAKRKYVELKRSDDNHPTVHAIWRGLHDIETHAAHALAKEVENIKESVHAAQVIITSANDSLPLVDARVATRTNAAHHVPHSRVALRKLPGGGEALAPAFFREYDL